MSKVAVPESFSTGKNGGADGFMFCEHDALLNCGLAFGTSQKSFGVLVISPVWGKGSWPVSSVTLKERVLGRNWGRHSELSANCFLFVCRLLLFCRFPLAREAWNCWRGSLEIYTLNCSIRRSSVGVICLQRPNHVFDSVHSRYQRVIVRNDLDRFVRRWRGNSD